MQKEMKSLIEDHRKEQQKQIKVQEQSGSGDMFGLFGKLIMTTLAGVTLGAKGLAFTGLMDSFGGKNK